MSSTAATRRASTASSTEQQPCLGFELEWEDVPDEAGTPRSGSALSTPSGDPSRMNTPSTSYPSRSSSAAATELSTPPLIATTTFLRTALIVSAILCRGDACVALCGWATQGSPLQSRPG